mmetsp:Transcript_20915/g.73806  ORF Transcript_20915/g.73806 Transcript_20915/m.73806 type:complete len:229 (+) Transcript_20915:484-1170(+)
MTRRCSPATSSRPLSPSLSAACGSRTTATSATSAPGSMLVNTLPVFLFQILRILGSVEMTLSVPPWYLMSTIGSSYWCSLTSTGRVDRRSNSATWPALVPTAMPMPRASKRSAVTSRPPAPTPAPSPVPAVEMPCRASTSPTSTAPARRRARGSQHSTTASSPPHASSPCSGCSPRQLTPGEETSKGALNVPSSRFRRYTSDAEPPTSRSQLCGSYAMSRPKCGTRVR